ncbi:MAG: hypothetical protein VX764_10235 [Planctomycetota bacterium]|nr:hypothetical protein [Planctomycetota bacterium]
MAAKNETSDFTQILLLTLFLCSAVFGAWGWWIKSGAQEYEAATIREARNFSELKDFLASAESKEVVEEHRRREESKKKADKTSSIISQIIEDMRNSTAKPEVVSSDSDKRELSGLTKHTYTATFANKPLRDHITFLEKIRTRAPHLGFEKLELTNKTKRNSTNTDTWELRLKLVSYSGGESTSNSE